MYLMRKPLNPSSELLSCAGLLDIASYFPFKLRWLDVAGCRGTVTVDFKKRRKDPTGSNSKILAYQMELGGLPF